MITDEGIYADLPEDDMEDIYADLEDELNKAGYDPELMLDQPTAPALPFRNTMVTKEPPQQSKEPKINKRVKKEKVKPSVQKKKGVSLTTQQPGTKQNPLLCTGTGAIIPTDMLNQRRLLKKVERIEPRRAEAEEPQTDFRSNLRKLKPEAKADAPKAPPPLLKPKPSLSSIDIDPGRIRYRRLPLSRVDLSNPPAVNRDKKPRLTVRTQDIDDTGYEDDVYDDVTNVIDQDLYDDVDNLSFQPNGHYADQAEQDVYDDVDNLTDMGPRDQPNQQDIYDDVENQNPDLGDEYYDDVESIGITRKASSDVYDDVENVGITRKVDSPTDTYDDICSSSAAQKAGPNEEMYETPDDLANQKESVSPGKKLSASQEKKLKSEEIKVRKKQMENEKRRQKELEKYTKEMEKKRKVFMEYYNIKDSDKPLMVAQVSSIYDLGGKQNLEVDIGDVVHVLCKEHKKMPKGAWLAEKSDHSAIGFIAPGVLNQNMLSTFDDY